MNAKPEEILSITQVRVGRPTNQLAEMIRFYCEGMGLELLMNFPEDQAGYAGAVLGVPGSNYHLEFCVHEDGFTSSQISPPTDDHLFVLYLPGKAHYDTVVGRLQNLGHQPVRAKNSHWDLDGVTFKDPDGWRVVLMRQSNI
jgi:catechol 2,3-dioxygenase-like lactoylglutathione lyase family enzyme